MAQTPEFKYAPMFQLGKDETEYYLLSKEGISVSEFEGNEIFESLSRSLNHARQHCLPRCKLPFETRTQRTSSKNTYRPQC